MVCEAEDTAFTVTWVASIEDAHAALTSDHYDVALVDHRSAPRAGSTSCGGCAISRLAAARAAGRVRGCAAGRRSLSPRRRRLPGEGRSHGAGAPAGAAPRRRAQPDRGRAPREPGASRAGRAHRQPRAAGGRVAHDFNNLLTGILGCTSRSNASSSRSIRRVSRWRDPAVRRAASRLTRQLLAYSRKQTLEPVPLDLSQVVEGMLEMIRRLIGDHVTFASKRRPACRS